MEHSVAAINERLRCHHEQQEKFEDEMKKKNDETRDDIKDCMKKIDTLTESVMRQEAAISNCMQRLESISEMAPEAIKIGRQTKIWFSVIAAALLGGQEALSTFFGG